MGALHGSVDAELLLAQAGWVRNLARTLVEDPAGAEDVAQQTLLEALDRPPDGAGTEKVLRAWLARVLRNLAHLRFRVDGRRRSLEESTARPERQPSSAEVVLRAEQHRRVVEAVMGLEEPYRTTVLLRTFSGLSTAAIADEQGLSRDAVRKRISRGIEMLRARLDAESGGDRNAWCLALSVLSGSSAWKSAVNPFAWEVLTMGAKLKTGIAAAALLAAATLLWRAWPMDSPPREVGGAEPVEAAELEPAAAVESEEASTFLAPPELGAGQGRAELEIEGTESCLLVVTTPDGGPLARRPIVVYEGDSLLAGGETDAEGRFACPARGGFGSLVVLPRGSAPQRLEIALDPGRREVPLERRAVVSGRIVVDGGPPRETRELTLFADHLDRSIEAVPERVWEELGLARPTRVTTHCEPDGAFLFWGLAPDWNGELWLPRRYEVRDRDLLASPWARYILRLERPVEGLRIDVGWNPVLTGRVIDVAGGEPVAGARVSPGIRYPKPFELALAYETDAAGRFQIPLRSRSVLGGSLHVQLPGRGASRTVPLEPVELSDDWDLGDVELYVTVGSMDLAVVVRDRSGSPIRGAVAVAEEENAIPSQPTDGEGRTLVHA